MTFKQKQDEAKENGLILERDPQYDHKYCLWFNSKTGSKEIWCVNFKEVDQATVMLLSIRDKESKIQKEPNMIPPKIKDNRQKNRKNVMRRRSNQC